MKKVFGEGYGNISLPEREKMDMLLNYGLSGKVEVEIYSGSAGRLGGTGEEQATKLLELLEGLRYNDKREEAERLISGQATKVEVAKWWVYTASHAVRHGKYYDL